MSDKRKISTILGVCCATVLAAGGSAYLMKTGLSMLDTNWQEPPQLEGQATEVRETEQPVTEEQFSKTEDSFVVLAKNEQESETESVTTEPETEKETEKTDTQKDSETEKSTAKKTTEKATEKTTQKTTEKQTEKKTAQKQTEKQTEKNSTMKNETVSGRETEAKQPTVAQTKEPSDSASKSNTGSAVTAAASGPMYATMEVNVRTSADPESLILGTLDIGESIVATGRKIGNWVEVTYGGKTGYVNGKYLTSDASGIGQGWEEESSGGSSSGAGSSSGGSSSDNGGSSGVIVVSGTMYAKDGVNVRKGPGKDYGWLGAIGAGESIGVTGNTSGNWTEVSYNGQIGYIYTSYLTWDPNDIYTGGGSSSGGSSGGGSSSGGSSGGAWDDSYYMYDTSTRYLSEEELSGWSLSDLAMMRNEIFAKHGRIFTSQSYRDYFSQKTWYTPTYDPSYFDSNMSSFLNEYELANLDLILRLEDERS